MHGAEDRVHRIAPRPRRGLRGGVLQRNQRLIDDDEMVARLGEEDPVEDDEDDEDDEEETDRAEG